MSWYGEDIDCCKWSGVACNNVTGHVKELHFSNTHNFYGPVKGKINPSLLNLKHLSHLDLSYNDFGRSRIPSFIGSLVWLRFLDLKDAGFGGPIPHQLGYLPSLFLPSRFL